MTRTIAALAFLALALAACSAIDAVVPPPSGPCRLVTPDAVSVGDVFAGDTACVVVAWDTTAFPGAIGADGGVGEPPELLAAAEEAGFLSPCSTTTTPDGGILRDAAGRSFADRFGRLGPTAAYWNATLFVRYDAGDGKGFCRDWMGIR